jgi:hypothetical protein
MVEDFNLIYKSHDFLICLFSLFFLQYSNVKIILTINSNYFLYLKEFHILAQNKDRSLEKEYNYNAIKNECLK